MISIKLSKESLLEIFSIFQEALLSGKDASQGLRDLEFVIMNDELVLSQTYIDSHPRATQWSNEEDEEM